MAQDSGIKIRIRLKAYDHKVIDQSAKQIIDTAVRTGAEVAGPVPLPTRRSTFTVVKSPHVYKMGGESFEMRVHKRLIDITNATPKTIDNLQNLSLPAGVDAEIRMYDTPAIQKSLGLARDFCISVRNYSACVSWAGLSVGVSMIDSLICICSTWS